MKILTKIFTAVLIIFIPLIAILGAANIVLRMPDVYSYQFNADDLPGEFGFDSDMDSQKMGAFVSDFMIGKKAHFALNIYHNGENGNIFTAAEDSTMRHCRAILNWSLIGFAIFLTAAAAAYLILLKMKRKDLLRRTNRGSVIVFIAFVAIGILCFLIPQVRSALYGLLFQSALSESGIPAYFLVKSFANLCVMATLAISAIIMVLITSLTRKITRPRRMFKQH